MMRCVLRYATDNSSVLAFFSAHVSLQYAVTGNTGNTYSLCIFLFIFILAFLLFVMLATLLNAAHPSETRLLITGRRFPACVTVLPKYTYLSTCSMIFPSTATVDVMSFSLVLLRCMLRPAGLLASCMRVSVLSRSSGDIATRTVSSANIKYDRCPPSVLIPLSS